MMSLANLKIIPAPVGEDSRSPSPCSNLNIPINIISDESPEVQLSSKGPTLLPIPNNPHRLQITPPPSPTSLRRLSTVYPPSSPGPGSPCSSSSRTTPQSTPPTVKHIRGRRNTVCYNQTSDKSTPNYDKSVLVLPKIVRRTSAPQLSEIPSLARAGISTHNLLALIHASESLETLHKII